MAKYNFRPPKRKPKSCGWPKRWISAATPTSSKPSLSAGPARFTPLIWPIWNIGGVSSTWLRSKIFSPGRLWRLICPTNMTTHWPLPVSERRSSLDSGDLLLWSGSRISGSGSHRILGRYFGQNLGFW
jgi:hypothetical protein